jgi:hypothetical protein
MSFITQGLGAGASAARLLLLGFGIGEVVLPVVRGARGVAPGAGLEHNAPRRSNEARTGRRIEAGARRANHATGSRRN